MANRDIEKTIQQLKDSLPKVMDSVKKYVDIADELDSVMSAALGAKAKIRIVKGPIGPQGISDELAEKEGHLTECERALSDVTELVSRIDKILTTEKKTRELSAIRKSYQLQQNLLLDAIERIKKRFSQLAEGNMPKDIEKTVEFLIKKFEYYLSGNGELEVSNEVRRSKKETAFVKVLQIKYEGRSAFLCLSMNYNVEKAFFGKVLTSFFMDVHPRPPYEAGNKTWISGGFELDFNRAVGLLLYHDMHEALKDFPKEFKKYFKVSPKKLSKFLENDFILKASPNVGKGPTATFFILCEDLEVTKDGIGTGKISEPKLKSILSNIRNLYSLRKGFEISHKLNKVKRRIEGDIEEVYILEVKFYFPGIAKLAIGL